MGKQSVSLLRTGPTGPRTPAGKTKSKFNALKHGVLSSAAVLETESQDEYSRFVSELAEVLEPVGKLEETLVEKIATTIWRGRRLLRAEAAEILRGNLMAEETFANRVQQASLANAIWGDSGSIRKAVLSQDGRGLFIDIGLIQRLSKQVLEHGLDWVRDRKDLEDLFGKVRLDETEGGQEVATEGGADNTSLAAKYQKLFFESEEQGRGPKSRASQTMAEELSHHVDSLQVLALESAEREKKLKRFRAATTLIPDEAACERVIRYEAHLERTLDRALSQLERLQRMRLGQPVFPSIKVDLTK